VVGDLAGCVATVDVPGPPGMELGGDDKSSANAPAAEFSIDKLRLGECRIGVETEGLNGLARGAAIPSKLRCLAALYDMCVQQGSLKKAADEIRTRVFNEMPGDEFALTRIVVEERAKKASPRWRADCLSRRLSILERQPVTVSMDGQRSKRSNPGYYLLRNSPIKDLDDYLEG